MTPAELSAAWTERFAAETTTAESFGTLTVDVSPGSWVAALEFARSVLGCDYFDWLTGVDELDDGFRIVTHLFSLEHRHHLLIRTLIPRAQPSLATATTVYRGAAWHERETYEMFGVTFEGHPNLIPLLLPDGFEGNPLRKDFVLAARVAKPWPGAKEPGESSAGAPSRRRVRPPGVPENWGPQAATPAPARRERPEGRRPPRKQPAPSDAAPPEAAAPPEVATPPEVAESGREAAPAEPGELAPLAEDAAADVRPTPSEEPAPSEGPEQDAGRGEAGDRDAAPEGSTPKRRPRGVEGGGDA